MILFSEPNLIFHIYNVDLNSNTNRLIFTTVETEVSKFELNYSYGSTRKYYLIFPLNIVSFKIKNSNIKFLNTFKCKDLSFKVTIDCFDVTLEINNDLCNSLRLKLI